MNSAPNKIETITLFAEDLERSKLFYQDVFSLPVLFEDQDSAVFKFENMVINLLTVPAARDLIQPGVVASPGGWVAISAHDPCGRCGRGVRAVECSRGGVA